MAPFLPSHVFFGKRASSIEYPVTKYRSVAAEHSARVENLTIASADGDAERVELLIVFTGRDDEPRRVLLNLNRSQPAEFERQLRAALKEMLAAEPDLCV